MVHLKSPRNIASAALAAGFVCIAPAAATANAASESPSGQMPPYQGDLFIKDYESPDYCEKDAMQVRVVVDGVSPKGILTVEIYGNDEKLFLEREGRVRRVRVPAEDSPQTVCMTVDQEGPLAVAVYHDENANRKVDKKLLGIPKEAIGLSMNPELKLARPKFEETAVKLGMSGVDLWIELQYY